MSIATLLSQHHHVTAVDIIPEKVEMINNRKSPIQDDYIEKYLDNAKIEDAFYRDLAFGTGGLRGVIGAGTNRMNIYTVAKASQGLADYLKKNFAEPSVAIPGHCTGSSLSP